MVLARHPWNDTIHVFQPGAARRFSSVYVLFVNKLRKVPDTSSSPLIGQINRNIQGGNLVQGHSLENCGSHFSSPNSFTSWLTSGCCQPLGEVFALVNTQKCLVLHLQASLHSCQFYQPAMQIFLQLLLLREIKDFIIIATRRKECSLSK